MSKIFKLLVIKIMFLSIGCANELAEPPLQNVEPAVLCADYPDDDAVVFESEPERPFLCRRYENTGWACKGPNAPTAEIDVNYREHGDTGLCTFACRWIDSRCDVEPRHENCGDAYSQKLADLCTSLGGTCVDYRATPDSMPDPYCVPN